MPASELIAKTATEIVALLKTGEVTSLDLLDALEARIAEVEPAVNALPTLCLDRARDAAKTLAAKPVAERGVLAGMPVAIKDLLNVAGVRSTQVGSLSDHRATVGPPWTSAARSSIARWSRGMTARSGPWSSHTASTR